MSSKFTGTEWIATMLTIRAFSSHKFWERLFECIMWRISLTNFNERKVFFFFSPWIFHFWNGFALFYCSKIVGKMILYCHQIISHFFYNTIFSICNVETLSTIFKPVVVPTAQSRLHVSSSLFWREIMALSHTTKLHQLQWKICFFVSNAMNWFTVNKIFSISHTLKSNWSKSVMPIKMMAFCLFFSLNSTTLQNRANYNSICKNVEVEKKNSIDLLIRLVLRVDSIWGKNCCN